MTSAYLDYRLEANRRKSTQPGRSQVPTVATGAGRKQNGRFGDASPQKRIESHRSNRVVMAVVEDFQTQIL